MTSVPRRTAATAAALAFGVLAATVSTGGLGPAARADDAPLASYQALASASGVFVGIANGSIPAVPEMEFSGPTAQASLDTLGNSLAFASAPYPGSSITGLGQIVGSVYGAPLPAYPMYTSTDTIGESSDGGAPGLTFHAESQAKSAAANATIGSGPSGGESRATVADNTGSGGGLYSRGRSTFSFAGTGDVFSLVGVSDLAAADVDDSGVITTSSDLHFARLVVPGLAIRVPETTPGKVPLVNPIPNLPQPPPAEFPPIPLPYGGQVLYAPELGFANGTFTVTLPTEGTQRYAIPTAAVLEGLKAAGITATYQQPTDILEGKKKVGIISAGLTLSTTLPAPPVNLGYSGPTTVTYGIGRSVASIKGLALNHAPAVVDAARPSAPQISARPGIDLAGVLPGTLPGAVIDEAGTLQTLPSSSAAMRTVAIRGPVSRDSLPLYLFAVAVTTLAVLAAAALRSVAVSSGTRARR
jgi:hypothetical protein